MKKLTLEEAQVLLKDTGSMPNEFTVLAIAYSASEFAYYVKWFDEKEKEIYDDGVAQAKADGAKAAYSFTPSCRFSAIWFNENEDGVERPVAEIMKPEDVKRLSESSGKLTLVDKA